MEHLADIVYGGEKQLIRSKPSEEDYCRNFIEDCPDSPCRTSPVKLIIVWLLCKVCHRMRNRCVTLSCIHLEVFFSRLNALYWYMAIGSIRESFMLAQNKSCFDDELVTLIVIPCLLHPRAWLFSTFQYTVTATKQLIAQNAGCTVAGRDGSLSTDINVISLSTDINVKSNFNFSCWFPSWLFLFLN